MVLLKRLAAIYLIAVVLGRGAELVSYSHLSRRLGQLPDLGDSQLVYGRIVPSLMLLVNAWRRYEFSRRDRDRTVTREYLETNVALAASVVLNLWFFWNWLWRPVSGRRIRGGSLGPPGVVGLHQPAGRTLARLYRGLPLARRLRQSGSADGVGARLWRVGHRSPTPAHHARVEGFFAKNMDMELAPDGFRNLPGATALECLLWNVCSGTFTAGLRRRFSTSARQFTRQLC